MASVSASILVQRGSQVLSHIGSSLGVLDSDDQRLHWQDVQMKRIQLGYAGLESISSKAHSDKLLEKLESNLKSCSSEITHDSRTSRPSNRNSNLFTLSAVKVEKIEGLIRRSSSLNALADIRNASNRDGNSGHGQRLYVSPEVSGVKQWNDFLGHQQSAPYFGSHTDYDGSIIDLKYYKKKHQELLEKKKELNKIIQVARDHYFGRYGIQEEKWTKLVQRSSSKRSSQESPRLPFIRTQLEDQVLFRPYATCVFIGVQLIALIAMTALHGLAEVDIEPRVDLSSDVTTFLGVETVARWTVPNLWLGPSPRKLVESGALYAPCMREDINILAEIARNKDNSPRQRLGCCLLVIRKMAATTTEKECQENTMGVGHWIPDTPCGWRPPSSSNETNTARPCCVGIQGTCLLVTKSHCDFHQGIFHASGPEHCSQVNCLRVACGQAQEYFQNYTSDTSPLIVNSSPLSQHWRILTAMFLPSGWLSFVPTAAIMFVLGRRVEASAGWPRMVLIYLTCSSGGLLTGALFTNLIPHMGGHSAVSGLLGVVTVDVIQYSALVKFPWRHLTKLFIILTLELSMGTLPYIDNYELIGGFMFGILSAIVLLPYISLGRWHVLKRRLFIVLGTPTLLVLFAILLFLLYTVQTLHALCPACLSFTCAPYSDRMCDVMKLESERPNLS